MFIIHNNYSMHELQDHELLILLQVSEKYWWKGLNNDVDEYCRRCDGCQRVNAKPVRKKAELHPIPVPRKV